MQLVFNGLIAGSLAALLAGGLSLVYGVMGVFNLALGELALLGGYGTWWLHQVMHVPLFPSILGGLLFGACVTWLTFELAVAPFFTHHRFLPLVTTIAWSIVLDGVILLMFQERPRSILPGLKETFPFYGAHVSMVQVTLVFFTLLVLVVFATVFHSTAFGRRLRAVTQHGHAALSMGVNAPFIERCIFILSGLFAAAGGVFIGIDQSLTPTLAFSMTIKAYAAIIVGGKGNFWGAILCAYLIALVEQLVVGVHWFGMFYIPSGYQQTVAFLCIILFLLAKPEGLFATKVRTA